MVNVTTTYLLSQVTNGTTLPLSVWFSSSKAHQHVAQLLANGSEYSYTINPIELIGD